jgi:uncharacterized integral membrane protein (TIGR00698 family)
MLPWLKITSIINEIIILQLESIMPKRLAGLTFTVIITLTSMLISQLPLVPFTMTNPLRHPIEPLVIALLLGIIIANIVHMPDILTAGIKFSAKKLLPLAVVLMGARLNLRQLLKVSVEGIIISVICVLVTLIFTYYIARWLKLERKLTILIGIGTAICGSSAIVAIAPIIKAKQNEIILAIATVSLLGTIAIFAFPLLGHALHLNQMKFGIWAGASIQAVPQVVAAGFSYGAYAGKIATTVKLIRVLLLIPVMFILTIVTKRNDPENNKSGAWYHYVPPMVIGFIIIVTLNSFGVFSSFNLASITWNPGDWLTHTSDFLIITTMAGVGLSTNIRDLFKGGIKVLLVGFIVMLLLSALSLAILTI